MNKINLKKAKILLSHSNVGNKMAAWHLKRSKIAFNQGYDLEIFSMSDLYPYTIFPVLDKKWKRKDYELMKFYETLGEKIQHCDVFIHYNGCNIHPEFLSQFNQLKIYHCADDPDASEVISKPVVHAYDICAISNPTSIKDYKKWGCENVFFWPLGSVQFDEKLFQNLDPLSNRRDEIIFIGSKNGVPKYRYFGEFFNLYKKRKFMIKLEKEFPNLKAFGKGWKNGFIDNNDVPFSYLNSRIGLNVHNSIGPVNSRLYDLAAFGVLQICDNKDNLDHVFKEGLEIIGFNTIEECIEKIKYYSTHLDESQKIVDLAKKRFEQNYTDDKIWENFINNINNILNNQ